MATATGNTNTEINNINFISYTGILPKLVFDNDTFEILHANSFMAEILGYTEEELSGLNLKDLIEDNFSELIDNENIQFPVSRITRQFKRKNGNVITYLSESCEIDFDCSALMIHYNETIENNRFNPEIFAEHSFANVIFNSTYINN
jgi:PAS domain-containing protein